MPGLSLGYGETGYGPESLQGAALEGEITGSVAARCGDADVAELVADSGEIDSGLE